jgi:hypothetical protein
MFSTDLMNQIIKVIDPSLKWLIVSSFESNCNEWKENLKDSIILTTKNLKLVDCKNVILESVLDQTKIDLFKDVENLIVITQKPKFYTRTTFTDVYISSSKNKKKLAQYHEFFKFPFLSFDEFNQLLKTCNFIHVNSSNILFKKQSLDEDLNTLKVIKNNEDIKVIKNNEDIKVIKCKNEDNTHTTKLLFQVQVSDLLNSQTICNDIKKMSSESIISNMFTWFTYDIKGQLVSGSFDVRKKRFDLFGILLLNIIKALKQESKITQGSIII